MKSLVHVLAEDAPNSYKLDPFIVIVRGTYFYAFACVNSISTRNEGSLTLT